MPWYGASNIYFQGKLYTGPSSGLWPIGLVSGITFSVLIVWLSSYDLIVVEEQHVALFYGFILSIGALLYNYWACCFKDPGVILRHPNFLQLDKEKRRKQKEETEARNALRR